MKAEIRALIIVDHGSTIDEANKLLITLSKNIKKHTDCNFTIVEYCHMELAEPTISDAFRKCINQGAKEVVVHPYFLVPGRHSKTDIPNMVKDVAKSYPDIKYRVTEPLGLHEKIVDVILERANT